MNKPHKPHKHAELIKAWADGAEIEYMNSINGWMKVEIPTWDTLTEYRIKDPYRELKEAQAQGKTIQLIQRNGWIDWSCEEFKFSPDCYRIKPDQARSNDSSHHGAVLDGLTATVALDKHKARTCKLEASACGRQSCGGDAVSLVTQCSRCLKTFVDQVGLHTCTPTNEWLRLEQLADKDYDDMRRFQAKYIEAAHELTMLKEQNVKLVEALEKLARLGNEPYLGNSYGNVIAREALASARPQSMDNGQENLRDSEKSSTN